MTTNRRASAGARAAGVFSIVVVLVLVAYFAFLRSGTPYQIKVDFRDGGQLIKGDLVEVAGLPIGKISNLTLTPDGLAQLTLNINKSEFSPLHAGTTASIGTVSVVGIANRYVVLNPGLQSTATLPNGSILDESQTQPLVDIDQFIDYATPAVVDNFRLLIQEASVAFAHPKNFQSAYLYFNPAFSQLSQLFQQFSGDSAAFSELIGAGSQVAGTLAANQEALSGAITNLATDFNTLAGQREALGDTFARAPAVLAQTSATLNNLQHALVAFNPAIKATQPVAKPLADLLREIVPAGKKLIPVVNQFDTTVPAVDTALSDFPALRTAALPTFTIFTQTLNQVLPIVTAARPYAQDILQGLFRGAGGESAGSYDADGHYIQAQLGTTTGIGTGIDALVEALNNGALPTFRGLRTGLLYPCPGGAGPPAADGSSPNLSDTSTCDQVYDVPSDR